MRAKSRRKKNKPPSFMVHPKWTGGGPYVVWADAGTLARADAYRPMPLENDPALFRALYEAVDYVRDLQSRHMGGGGEYAVRNGQGVLVWRSLTDRTSGRDPRRSGRGRTRRDMDHRYQLPGGLEFTAEERARMEKHARRARKIRALGRGAASAGSHQAPKGLRDPTERITRSVRSPKGRRFTLDQPERIERGIGNVPADQWPILYKDQRVGTLILDGMFTSHGSLWRASTRELASPLAWSSRGLPTGIGQDVGPFNSSKEAFQAFARSADELLDYSKKRDPRRRDPEVRVPRGASHGRDFPAFATEVRALLYARGLPKSQVVAAVERARAIVHDAWRTGKTPCSVADKLAVGAARMRDPRRKSKRRARSKRKAR